MELREGGREVRLTEQGIRSGCTLPAVLNRTRERLATSALLHLRACGSGTVVHMDLSYYLSNSERPSNNRRDETLRKKVLDLSREVYWDFNDTHSTEKFRECEGIGLNRETVRNLRREAGMAPKRRRRGPKHLKRRERNVHGGMEAHWSP
jgi:hypothetical protein